MEHITKEEVLQLSNAFGVDIGSLYLQLAEISALTVPTDGFAGYVLTKTAGGFAWIEPSPPVTSLPWEQFASRADVIAANPHPHPPVKQFTDPA